MTGTRAVCNGVTNCAPTSTVHVFGSLGAKEEDGNLNVNGNTNLNANLNMNLNGNFEYEASYREMHLPTCKTYELEHSFMNLECGTVEDELAQIAQIQGLNSFRL